jgi:hypothetical protein
VDSAVDSAVKPGDWSSAWWWAGWAAGYAAWVDFYNQQLQIPGLEAGLIYSRLVESCGVFWTFEHAVFLSDRHTELHLNAQGRPHKDGGLAVSYGDGWGLHCLNGVRVPAELALTPADQLDPVMIATEKNVEVRREIVKKIGLQNIVRKFGGKKIHRWECESYQEPYREHVIGLGQVEVAYPPAKLYYELLEFQLGPEVRARALKMNNPSVDEIHVEFVPEDIDTVQKALAWREQDMTFIQPTVRT